MGTKKQNPFKLRLIYMTETIKISVPENIADITLDQYVKFEALRAREDKLTEQGMIERVISIFTGIKKQDVKKLVHKNYEGLMAQIIAACEQDVEFEQRFTLDGVEYGFIPNLDEITTAEYVDLSTIGLDFNNMHKIIAILFRRITEEDAFGNYEILPYSHNKANDEIMRRCPIKWGWYVSIEMLANHDILKIDRVLETKVHEFHTFLAHKLDRQKMEAQLRKPNVTQL